MICALVVLAVTDYDDMLNATMILLQQTMTVWCITFSRVLSFSFDVVWCFFTSCHSMHMSCWIKWLLTV